MSITITLHCSDRSDRHKMRFLRFLKIQFLHIKIPWGFCQLGGLPTGESAHWDGLPYEQNDIHYPSLQLIKNNQQKSYQKRVQRKLVKVEGA